MYGKANTTLHHAFIGKANTELFDELFLKATLSNKRMLAIQL